MSHPRIEPTAPPSFATNTDTGLDVVTGAFSYSGQAIARHLLGAGRRVRTLTGHPERGNGQQDIDVHALDFEDPSALVASLIGATTLYNTYWVRFAHGGVDHSMAVNHSRTLFEAARRAGVRKIVHVSILNPSTSSPYTYFRGKALVEQALADTGVPYASLRPSVLFDEGGVLINNIAWLLRHLPVFAVGGDGAYRVRPTHVDDLVRLAVRVATDPDVQTIDAVGPERPTFMELVTHIRQAVGSRARIVRVPPALLLGTSKVLGLAMRDVLLTADEYFSMAQGLADSSAPATGVVSVSQWVTDHGDTLGRRYANEINRHFRR